MAAPAPAPPVEPALLWRDRPPSLVWTPGFTHSCDNEKKGGHAHLGPTWFGRIWGFISAFSCLPNIRVLAGGWREGRERPGVEEEVIGHVFSLAITGQSPCGAFHCHHCNERWPQLYPSHPGGQVGVEWTKGPSTVSVAVPIAVVDMILYIVYMASSSLPSTFTSLPFIS